MESRAWSPGCRGQGFAAGDGCGAHPRRCPGRRAAAPSLSRAPWARQTRVGRGKRAAPLLQNIPWVRLVQQALLMRSIILLQKKGGQGDMPRRDPPGLTAGPAPCGPAPGGEGELPDAGREAAAGRGWGGPGPGAGESKGKKGMREMEGGKRRLKALPVPPAQSRHPRPLVVPANVLPPGAWPAGAVPVPAPGHCTA